MSGNSFSARRIPRASLLLSTAAAFIFLLPSLAAQLQYDRVAIAAGEIWRLVSGHWVHYSFDHFFWDVLAFGFLGLACERRSRSRFLACVIASAFAISLSVWFCLPGMRVYGGLSGVDSALFALLVVELWNEGIRARNLGQVTMAAACLAAFLFKISFELLTGNNVFVQNLESGTVGVPLAHIAGVTIGLLVGLGSVEVLRRLEHSHRINRRVLGSHLTGASGELTALSPHPAVSSGIAAGCIAHRHGGGVRICGPT